MPEATNGAAMREAYEDLGMTRQDFALRVGLSPQSVLNIANCGPCSKPAAVRIAKELGWSGPEVLFARPETTGADEATDETPDPATATSAEAEAEASVRRSA